ncbi:MAG TPA: DUF3159 domain-containing protein, partial [Baekduia sp.]|nr:DUF3159 domain-containing protein [Baekduia sp.]
MRDTDEITVEETQEHDAEPVPVPTLIESVGGPLGMAESAVPTVAFVIAYTASGQNLNLSAAIALGIAAIVAAVRLARHESPRQALFGLAGVAIAAFFATKTGKAENFYVPGLLLNAGYALAMGISVAVGWPAVGVVAGQMDGTGNDFREDPARRALVNRVTLMWMGMFLLRLAVQIPLYLAGSVVALGVARTAMGIPLFALCVWLSYSWMRIRPEPASPFAREPGVV